MIAIVHIIHCVPIAFWEEGNGMPTSTWVRELCVLKCVGVPSFKTARLELVKKFSIIEPRLLGFGEPQRGFHPFKSPSISIGVVTLCIRLERSVSDTASCGDIYRENIVNFIARLISRATAQSVGDMFISLCGIFFFISIAAPCLEALWVLKKYPEYCLGICGV